MKYVRETIDEVCDGIHSHFMNYSLHIRESKQHPEGTFPGNSNLHFLMRKSLVSSVLRTATVVPNQDKFLYFSCVGDCMICVSLERPKTGYHHVRSTFARSAPSDYVNWLVRSALHRKRRNANSVTCGREVHHADEVHNYPVRRVQGDFPWGRCNLVIAVDVLHPDVRVS
ncbi:hypothetical protein WA026_014607 [Henosepilachna vigintioctopunctata]|uniref:Uncharacterized protein n=1 Tax=Henosepilachna vigintioctopunctata TaxID=420089 RepID=A0AAW1VDZ4_9CUCU